MTDGWLSAGEATVEHEEFQENGETRFVLALEEKPVHQATLRSIRLYEYDGYLEKTLLEEWPYHDELPDIVDAHRDAVKRHIEEHGDYLADRFEFDPRDVEVDA